MLCAYKNSYHLIHQIHKSIYLILLVVSFVLSVLNLDQYLILSTYVRININHSSFDNGKTNTDTHKISNKLNVDYAYKLQIFANKRHFYRTIFIP